MKKHHIIPVFGMILAGSLTSCKKDFLNVVPLGNQIAVTTSDYDQLMNSPGFYFYSYAGGWQAPAIMGDEVAAEAPLITATAAYAPQSLRLFQWLPVITQQSDQTPWDLTNQLSNLYTCNKVIAEVDGSSGGTDAQKAELKAEAMAQRAWINFQFINTYAKPYLTSTAATDPGFPIIDKPDIAASKYTRASVQEVYDFIIKDLTAAIAGLPVKSKFPTRMSRPAAEGLLGKTYLYMGKYSDAVTQFKAALDDVAADGIPVLYDYNVTFAPGGSFLPIDPYTGPFGPGNNYNDLTEAVVSMVFYNGSYTGNILANNGLVLDPKSAALYAPSDWRLLFYSNNDMNGNALPNGRMRKYGVTFSRCGLQLPDLYLLSAEAKARTNDLPGAVTDIETLRKDRMPVADAPVPGAIASDQAALIKFIIDERIREFAMEGYRWFDMRRLSVDPLFTGKTYTHTLYKDDGTNDSTLYTLDQPNRFTLQLPSTFIGANPGMVNNP